MEKAWKQRLVIFVKGWGVSFIVALVIATSIKSAIADWNDVPTGSMIPTILAGDRIFINKLAYDLKIPYTTIHLFEWADPVRGEIVVFYSPEDGKRLVKRVVGLPGDTLQMKRNRLFIKGKPLNYEAFNAKETIVGLPVELASNLFFEEKLTGRHHPVMLSPFSPSMLNTFGPVQLPESKYFMMGDNRDNSADSRFFGTVDRKLIVGRATAVVLSRDKSILHPRWERFFQKLI